MNRFGRLWGVGEGSGRGPREVLGAPGWRWKRIKLKCRCRCPSVSDRNKTECFPGTEEHPPKVPADLERPGSEQPKTVRGFQAPS